MAQDDNDETDEKLPFHPINWFNVTSEGTSASHFLNTLLLCECIL